MTELKVLLDNFRISRQYQNRFSRYHDLTNEAQHSEEKDRENVNRSFKEAFDYFDFG